MSSSKRVKVLYIAGAGRSGSTILGNLLGQVEGFFSCGELYNLYRTPPDQRYCGCGKVLPECEVWNNILKGAFGEDYAHLFSRLWLLRNRYARSRYLLFWANPRFARMWEERASEYLQWLRKLYLQIVETTGADVIVDSSKAPVYGLMLSRIPEVDVRLVFLVRDPRAVAYSWQRKKLKHSPQGEIYIKPSSALLGALDWLAHNLATELMLTSSRVLSIKVRYEHLMKSPQRVAEQIAKFSSDKSDKIELLPIDGNRVFIKAQHTVEGNPDRFQQGWIELKPDDEWRTEMRPASRAMVSLLTMPLMLGYGYRW